MFVVSELCDVVRVEPDKLTGKSIYEALRQALNNKFVNKVRSDLVSTTMAASHRQLYGLSSELLIRSVEETIRKLVCNLERFVVDMQSISNFFCRCFSIVDSSSRSWISCPRARRQISIYCLAMEPCTRKSISERSSFDLS